MSSYQIVRDTLNWGLTVYGWHKFNAWVGTINDFFNCMPNWIISQGKESPSPTTPPPCTTPPVKTKDTGNKDEAKTPQEIMATHI